MQTQLQEHQSLAYRMGAWHRPVQGWVPVGPHTCPQLSKPGGSEERAGQLPQAAPCSPESPEQR